ncbi:MAG: ferritin-like domain-containing protein [Polyangiaceae bacterium]
MRNSLSRRHTDTLRLALFSALGVLPLSACGGNTDSQGSGGTSAAGGAAAAGGTKGSGGSAASGGMKAGGGSTGVPFPCLNPTPVTTDPTGTFIQCQGGWKHREIKATCPSKLPRPTVLPPSNYPSSDECHTDADCVARPNGHCENPGSGLLAPPTNGCYYGCTSDADCDATAPICECGPNIGTCVAATCTTDADCGTLKCASYTANPGCDIPSYACQLATDQCAGDGDCPSGQTCTVRTEGSARICSLATCVAGRPFLVEGQARRAETIERSDWAGTCAVALAGLSSEQRSALGRHWADIGCLEHASIAAFARFTLELLSFGAPRELVELCNGALRDETLHTELAFALASAYHGARLGPGALDVGGALDVSSLAHSVRTAFVEGCIGESVAAIEAATARDAALDPCVAQVLELIARDEACHAELAFRFVKWALPRCDASLGQELLSLAQSELERAGVTGSDDSGLLRVHGVLPATERAALRRDAISNAVIPCLRELLQNTAGSVYVPNTERSTSHTSPSVA